MEYIFVAGKPRRVMHIAAYDRCGRPYWAALCGIGHPFNRTINAPFALGRKVCKRCAKQAQEMNRG